MIQCIVECIGGGGVEYWREKYLVSHVSVAGEDGGLGVHIR